MAGNNKYNNKLKDILLYLKGLLSGREKNRLERNLEKDPFEKEAMEGFQSIKPSQLEKDVLDLNLRLEKRTERKDRRLYFSIAASIAVIITVSVLYFTLFNNELENISGNREITQSLEEKQDIPMVSDSLTEETEKDTEKQVASSVVEKSIREVTTEKDEVKQRPQLDIEEIGDEKEEVSPSGTQAPPEEEKITEYEAIVQEEAEIDQTAITKKSAQPASRDITAKISRPITAEGQKSSEMISGKDKISGVVVSSEDSMPIPGATIRVRGLASGTVTDTEGKFEIERGGKDSLELVAGFVGMEDETVTTAGEENLRIVMEPSAMTLDEVVVIQQGKARDPFTSEAVSEIGEIDTEVNNTYRGAYPLPGKSEFQKYLEENMRFPESDQDRAVVVLKFIVSQEGRPVEIEIVRSPGIEFSREAIRLLREGPDWIPAENENQYIKDPTRVRIVFKKD